jgi:ATP-dependent DNA helicase RecQ
MQLVRDHAGESGIVYCSTRKQVEAVHELLVKSDVAATRYHAGLSSGERTRNQRAFVNDDAPVIVATNAFGMGIDKSNVSFVVHYNMPKNLESYYQEAGRAGRDGSRADCILLYAPGDVRTNQFMIDHSNDNEELDEMTRARLHDKELERLKQMTFYCTRHECLRSYMLRYFGEETHNYCGNCSSCRMNYEKRDISVEALKIVSCVYRLHQRNLHFGVKAVTDILRGSKAEKYEKFHFADSLSTYGIMQDVSEKQCREIIDYLVAEEYLSKTGEYAVLTLNGRSARLLKERPALSMNILREEQPEPRQRADRGLPGDLEVRAEGLEMILDGRNPVQFHQCAGPFGVLDGEVVEDGLVLLDRHEGRVDAEAQPDHHHRQQEGVDDVDEVFVRPDPEEELTLEKGFQAVDDDGFDLASRHASALLCAMRSLALRARVLPAISSSFGRIGLRFTASRGVAMRP